MRTASTRLRRSSSVVRIVRVVGREDRQRLYVGHALAPDIQSVDGLSGRGESGQVADGTARREDPFDRPGEAEGGT